MDNLDLEHLKNKIKKFSLKKNKNLFITKRKLLQQNCLTSLFLNSLKQFDFLCIKIVDYKSYYYYLQQSK